MQTYDSEEVKAYVAHCKEKGIQDSSRLFWLQTAMRAGIDKDLLESLEDPKLTNYDAFRILGCNTMGIPNEILTEITKKPETITERIEKYYEEKYTPDKKKIYQEIFDSFQVQWQQNFNQLLKQTELLSDTQEFTISHLRRQSPGFSMVKFSLGNMKHFCTFYSVDHRILPKLFLRIHNDNLIRQKCLLFQTFHQSGKLFSRFICGHYHSNTHKLSPLKRFPFPSVARRMPPRAKRTGSILKQLPVLLKGTSVFLFPV